jgi:RHS repeat-associated protein
LSYTYDQIGNLMSNSQVGTYTYPLSGSTSVRPHAVSTAGSNSYTYDNNGNMSGGASRTLTYNTENRPTSITSGGSTTTFVYDGDGGRVKKIEGGLTTIYIGRLYECSGTTAPYPCVKYIFAGGQRIAMKQVNNGVVDYFHPDHLGSTSVMTTATGTQEQSLAYYPYGGTRLNTGTVNVPYKYTGKELDASTGLYFYEARYYDATLGRFISADTIVPNPRDPQDLNRYTYAGNNPLIYTDPTGHLRLGRFFRRTFGDVRTAIGCGDSNCRSGRASLYRRDSRPSRELFSRRCHPVAVTNR